MSAEDAAARIKWWPINEAGSFPDDCVRLGNAESMGLAVRETEGRVVIVTRSPEGTINLAVRVLGLVKPTGAESERTLGLGLRRQAQNIEDGYEGCQRNSRQAHVLNFRSDELTVDQGANLAFTNQVALNTAALVLAHLVKIPKCREFVQPVTNARMVELINRAADALDPQGSSVREIGVDTMDTD